MNAVTGDRCRQLRRGFVLGNIVGFDAGNGNGADAGGLEGRNVGVIHHASLLEYQATLADRMDDDATFGVAGRDGSEFHFSFPPPFAGEGREVAGSRSAAVISAMMET